MTERKSGILDHALFGPQDLSLRPLFDIFPVQTVVQLEINASDLSGVSGYHRAIINDSLHCSTRNQPSSSAHDESEPELPDSVSPVVSSASGSDADSNSEWETMFEPGSGPENMPPARDHHVQAWVSLHASRHRPRPAVGHSLPIHGHVGDATTFPAPTSHTIPIEPVNPRWLQGLSRFGPAPDEPCIIPNTFDRFNPVTPPWLAQLHEEWVKPTEFHDL